MRTIRPGFAASDAHIAPSGPATIASAASTSPATGSTRPCAPAAAGKRDERADER